jgi:biotin-dependent carboxylase-like uncharacterized protein
VKGLRVLRPGPLSLLQDGGRWGWQHLGVSPAGAVDPLAAAWANRLLGNPRGTPLLEIALGGVELQSEVDTWVALCGADLPVTVDGQPRPAWSRFAVRRGQLLQLGHARSGQRGYLAVAGGFCAPALLGSVSVQLREGLGRALQAGDRLPCRSASLPGCASVPWRWQADYRARPLLRVITGGDAGRFAEDSLQAFFARPWQLSPASDRSGARLLGEPLSPPHMQWSQGMASGAVQVPPDGLPIILLADRPSMGGYPVLGWLHPLDSGRLAQQVAHAPLHFTPVSLGDAQAELREYYRFFGR